MFLKAVAMALVLCLLPVFALAEETSASKEDWVTFLLICNEGMINSGGNSGNTMMVVGMNPVSGDIRLMSMTWDTFVTYEGYDVPQKIDMPYRNNGPQETMKVFNDNFNTDITLYLSLNYLNLAALIDDYGGVDVDISRAERNALNGMVASKVETLQAQIQSGLLSQLVAETLGSRYYLNEYGPETHLNGLQAVGFGWLQYDSVYNCCLRDLKVISNLFNSVGTTIADKVIFTVDGADEPEGVNGRKVINLDALTEEDKAFLRAEIDPIFQMSENNLTEDDILGISLTFARTAYMASRQGQNILGAVKTDIFPLEATDEYEVVAGTKGHVIDMEANSKAIEEFLYK